MRTSDNQNQQNHRKRWACCKTSTITAHSKTPIHSTNRDSYPLYSFYNTIYSFYHLSAVQFLQHHLQFLPPPSTVSTTTPSTVFTAHRTEISPSDRRENTCDKRNRRCNSMPNIIPKLITVATLAFIRGSSAPCPTFVRSSAVAVWRP